MGKKQAKRVLSTLDIAATIYAKDNWRGKYTTEEDVENSFMEGATAAMIVIKSEYENSKTKKRK